MRPEHLQGVAAGGRLEQHDRQVAEEALCVRRSVYSQPYPGKAPPSTRAWGGEAH